MGAPNIDTGSHQIDSIVGLGKEGNFLETFRCTRRQDIAVACREAVLLKSTVTQYSILREQFGKDRTLFDQWLGSGNNHSDDFVTSIAALLRGVDQRRTEEKAKFVKRGWSHSNESNFVVGGGNNSCHMRSVQAVIETRGLRRVFKFVEDCERGDECFGDNRNLPPLTSPVPPGLISTSTLTR